MTDPSSTSQIQEKRRRLDPRSSSSTAPFTVFISHAGEDKATIAIPLRERLREKGISAFVDEADMPPGTEAKSAMIRAMNTAKIGVIVLSPEFVVKEWPIKELMCFLKRREVHLSGENEGVTVPTIVPFFYRLSVGELYEEPKLDRKDRDGVLLHEKSRFYERQKNGEPEANVSEIKKALSKLHGIMGVRNTVEANNDSSYDMSKKRKLVLDELCDEICRVEYEIMKLEASKDSGQGRACDSPRTKRVRVAPTGRGGVSVEGRVERDAMKAEKPYSDNYQIQSSDVLFNLAVVLDQGVDGVKPNAVQAAKLYRLAVDAGNVDAMYELARMLQNGAEGVGPDAVEAAKLYRRAIEFGSVNAMNNLAVMLEKGTEGVKRDTAEAEKLYRRAIEGGDANAMFNLALMLTKGEDGVVQNVGEGKKLFRRAIEAGHVNSMYALALLLDDGTEDTERDAVEAAKLFRSAIESGHVEAMLALAVKLENGAKGVGRDAVEAEKLYRRAAEAGDARAMLRLGLMLQRNAEGVESDAAEAKKLVNRGAVQIFLAKCLP